MNKYRVTIIDPIDRIVVSDKVFDYKEDADIECYIWCEDDWIIKRTELEAAE
jgi:hypothetical protein